MKRVHEIKAPRRLPVFRLCEPRQRREREREERKREEGRGREREREGEVFSPVYRYIFCTLEAEE